MGENEDAQQEQGPATIFPTAGEFVHSWLLQVVNRKVNSRDTFWCAQWWKHPEAVCRLTALWLSWEAAREDPTSLASWWRDQLDYHMSVLMSSTGPFRYCEDGEHNASRYSREAFPIQDPPRGVFDLLG